MMASAVLRPRLCEASWYKRMKCKNSNTLNPRPTKSSHNVGNQTYLQHNNQTLLKVSPELRNKVDSKILGQKRVVHVTPDRKIKRRRVELYSMEMRKCGVILEKLMNHKHALVFNEPVNVVALGLRDYRQIVKHPMDLGTVKLKLDIGLYENSLDFAQDVRLTFHNARLYNQKGDDVHTMATVLLDMFDKMFDPTCEKFEVERGQSVIVEQQKFSKPLAEFTKSQLVSSQQVTERPLHMHPQEAVPKKICKEVVKKTESEQIRTVPQAKENPPMRREMSEQERDQLGLVLKDFADKYLDEILQIVAKRNSNMTTPDEEGEIELDIQAVDSETMWDLHRFLRLKLKAEQNSKIVIILLEVTPRIVYFLPLKEIP